MLNTRKLTAEEQGLFFNSIQLEDYQKCSELLEQGADINIRGKFSNPGRNGLFFQLVDSLHPSKPCSTALEYAVKNYKKELTEYLLKRGANTEITDQDGITVLTYAAKECTPDFVELLLKYGANPNFKINNGYVSSKSDFFLTDSYPLQSIFLGLNDWDLTDDYESEAIKKTKLLLDNGATLYPNLFLDDLKQRGYSNKVISFFCRVWENQQTNIDKAYIKGAAAGALKKAGLPTEIGYFIGGFFNRKVGSHLAQTCKRAVLFS